MNRFDIQYNSDVVKDLQKIDEKIQDLRKSDDYKPLDETKLRMAKLLKGLELSSGPTYYNRNTRPF